MDKTERRFQEIFNRAPIALVEQELSQVLDAVDELNAAGVVDFPAYLTEHPEKVVELMQKIRVFNPNQYTLRLFKLPPGSELPVEQTMDGATLPRAIAQLTAIANNDELFSCESYARTMEGERIHLLFIVTRLFDSDIRGHCLVTIVDISERKRMEEMVRAANTELQRSNEELEQFAYVASHDLQEPLRIIASYGQLMEKRGREILDERMLKYIEYMVEGAKRMQALISDLLGLSSIGTSDRPPRRTDCTKVLEEVLDYMQVTLTESGATVEHDPLPSVMIDPRQLAQLLQNLIGNGIKFRRELPPHIHIGARRSGGEWIISVQDNGIGMEADEIHNIFVIFKRLHGRGDYPGTGIGLAIAKKIVERHHGRIWVESEVGKGSTFYFALPVVDAEPEHASPPKSDGAGQHVEVLTKPSRADCPQGGASTFAVRTPGT